MFLNKHTHKNIKYKLNKKYVRSTELIWTEYEETKKTLLKVRCHLQSTLSSARLFTHICLYIYEYITHLILFNNPLQKVL